VRGLETGDGALLSAGLNDVLHVPFRETLVPGFAAVVEAAQRAGAFGATLSGSGSAIVAIATRARASDVGAAMCRAWRTVDVQATAFVNPPHVAGYDVRHLRSSAANKTLHNQSAKSDHGELLCQ
jgi:homoserine kinase